MRTLVVYCHPDPQSFTAAVRDRAVSALRRSGHDVRVTDLYAEGFDPLFSAEERQRHLEPGPDPSVAHHAADLQWCERLVLIYPTWWSGQPAILTGWLAALPSDALRGVARLVAVTTHGSSKWVNLLEGETGRRIVTHTLRRRCAPGARAEWHAFYGIDRADDARRTAFVAEVERTLSRSR